MPTIKFANGDMSNLDYNPHHGPNGQFASSSSSAGSKFVPDKRKAASGGAAGGGPAAQRSPEVARAALTRQVQELQNKRILYKEDMDANVKVLMDLEATGVNASAILDSYIPIMNLSMQGQGKLELFSGTKSVTLEFEGISSDRSFVTISRSFSKDGKTVTHNELNLPPSVQGKGIGKKLLRDQVAMYTAPGSKIEAVKLTAALSAGGYTWGRFGFKPKPEAMGSLSRQLIKNTKPGTAAHSLAMELSTSKNPVKAFRAIVNSESGKSLLAGTEWTGSLDLKDKASMDIFNAYTK